MATPINHHLTIIDHTGKCIRTRVMFVQPVGEQWPATSAEVHIETDEWLAQESYTARYDRPEQAVNGNYLVWALTRLEEGMWLLGGTFTRSG
jgi:hypothetical protein